MPVTKKKGAIFAIFADSPTSSSESFQKSSKISSTKSPTKKSTLSTNTRKALTSIQPAPVKGFPRSGLESGGIKGLKGRSEDGIDNQHVKDSMKKLQSIPGSNVPSKPLLAKTQSSSSTIKRPLQPPIKTGPSKRQLEIFSSSPTEPIFPSQNSTKTISKSPIEESPIKRGRTSPRKLDKENIPPTTPNINGSPASHTRSRSRVSTTLTIESMSRNTSLIRESTSTIRRSSQISQIDYSDLQRRQGRDMAVAGLVGDGRGTLTLKKGRLLASLIRDDEDMGIESKTSVLTRNDSRKSRTAGKGKGKVVKDDGILADVSEAYGATGSEPEGFRS